MKKGVLFIIVTCALTALSCAESGRSELDGSADAVGEDAADGEMDGVPDAADDDVQADTGCLPGERDCDGLCVNTDNDHEHCGGCGQACNPAEVCAGGICLFECPSGTVACFGDCVDLSSDLEHCGSCDRACTAGLHAEPVCEMGVCGIICEEGWSDQDGDGSCESGCAPTSPTEICNGVDDNCDGQTDEGFPCRMGHEVGCMTVCRSSGTGICGLDCAIPDAELCMPPPEVCNAMDDDCDGDCDEDFGCCRGDVDPCTSACGTQGTRVCTALCDWSACIPPEEACNGLDDDCDGACDDGYGCCMGQGTSCTTSCGTTGSTTCTSACEWGACVPPAETCNGTDDDCDGTCDDGFGCCRGSSGSCSTSCGTTGSRTCSSSCTWGTCAPPAETCNNVDDDCDGTTDEGFRAENASTTYSYLVTVHSGCTGVTDRCGMACKCAINRFCAARACTTGGFGPIENSGDTAWAACVSQADQVGTTFTTLATHHPGCTSSAVAVSGACYAAINRFCASRGYVTGFGPVEYTGDNTTVVCVRAAVRVGTSYTVLASHHSGCDGTIERLGCACNAAINRFCQSQGHTSGYGPIESSGDYAEVFCVFP